MKNSVKTINIKKLVLCLLLILMLVPAVFVQTTRAEEVTAAPVAALETEVIEAAEDPSDNTVSVKAIAAAVAITVSATAAAFAMAMSISKSAESTARQPEAADGIRSNLLLGLVFIETAVIYALVIAIIIIFVL